MEDNKSLNDAARSFFKSICKSKYFKDEFKKAYEASVRLKNMVGHLEQNHLEQLVVCSILSFFESQSDEPLFEFGIGRYGIPNMYRLRKDISAGHVLKDGTLISFERGQDKGDFIPVSDIYKWLSEEAD